MRKQKYLTILIILVMALSLAGLSIKVSARPLGATSPKLGVAKSFAVLAGSGIGDTVTTSHITGDVGLYPASGAAITGLTCAEMLGPSKIYDRDGLYTGNSGGSTACLVTNAGLLLNAKNDLITAYDRLAATDNHTCTINYGAGPKDLTGLHLGPGVYCVGTGGFQLSGSLTLSGSEGVWIFRSVTTIITSSDSTITGGDPCNVWWRAETSATLGTGTNFVGNILALASIVDDGGSTISGRLLARNQAVTLNNTTVNRPVCAAPPPPTPTPTPAIVPGTGFAPQGVTFLSSQPASKAYTSMGDLWLEIPKLGVQMNIVGVPETNGTWDVSWLGKQAGWLNGSAFPTWAGNSVLTGHVWNADNTVGSFGYINTLWWGDKVIVHAWGAQYVYEVRSVMQVGPGSTAAMMKHETIPWVTLVTCRGYDQASNSYKYRVLVRAVLTEVK